MTGASKDNYYKYFAILGTHIVGDDTQASLANWELYGYEEDPPVGDSSLDATFTSIMNTPQTTGANVYVDGSLGETFTNRVTGPTPFGTATTYDSTGKYWELTGELTSNVTLEANTFLSGDAPHSLSMWFNSSNLEANVSNTCVFSVSDQEKLDSVNLDLQSNTWHNLTYAYQGEGGSRVTYLDGRKVSEDQAEDTFGDYPPFAMTGHSQGGYVVSASNYQSGYEAWAIFDQYEGTSGASPNGGWWQISSERYSTSGNYDYISGSTHNLGTSTGSSTSTDNGHWVKIEIPHKLKLSYVNMKSQQYHEQGPKDFKFYGSKNNKDWELIKSFTNATPLAGRDYTINSTVGYKAIGLVVTAINGHPAGQLALSDMQLYGHRENDLVRLPDPTNVLKYPHIQFPIGPNSNAPIGIRGYVASGSSSSNSGIGRRPWSAFNDLGEGQANLGGLWQNQEDGSNHKYTPQTTGLATTNAALFEGVRGEWIKLELPHKIKVSQVYILTAGAHEGVEKAILYGSNDDTNWDVIKDGGTAGVGFTFTLTANGGLKEATESVTTSNCYKYLLLQVTEVVVGSGSTDGRSLQLYKLQYFGTGVDSIPIQIGGGNIDKVANFRVYDKFIEEDQVNEIWNAQKEEFGRAKPQMVLQQGKLGIGTDAPQGSLSVADEPHNLEEFPPRAMTGEETYMEGHGVFKVALSSADNGNNKWTAFNKRGFTGVDDDDYLEWGSAQYTAATGVYTGSVSTQGVSGEWLEIEMPYKIKLEYNLLYHRTRDGMITNDYWVLERMPRDGAILGSNDGETWTTLQSWTDFDWVTGTSATGQRQSEYWRTPGKFVTNSTAYYKTFRLVFSKLFGANGDRPNIGEWRLFGTREQGQSVLHDGQLTLTKNLDVPRIGPPLDADDTPRRDRLVVEYNTSSNPTFEGAVRDTSGRGNDGVFYGDVSYDANEKALEFPGSDDFIFTHVQNILGAWKHSVSFWVKYDNTSTGMVFMMTKTGNTSGQANGSIGFSIAGGAFRYFFWGDDTDWNYSIQPGTLYHIVLTYDGGTANTSRKLYINGVDQGSPDARTSGQSGALDLETTTSQMKIGCGINNNEDLDGSVSNFKFYDCTLSAEEVKTLYDMGRNGSVANPQPLHIAAPLYAPGTIVQVEQSIKRDDSSTASTSASDIPGLSVTIHPKFGTSKILVSYQVNMGGNYHMFLRVKRTQNGTTTYVGNGNASGNRPLASSYQSHLHAAHVNSMNMEILDPANGTDPITYQIQFWVAHTNYAAWINRGTDNYNNIYGPAAQSSSITVKEVCQ